MSRSGVAAHQPELTYLCVQPNRWTFESDKIRQWVESQLVGEPVLNACAGRAELDWLGEVIRNDVNPEMPADMHHDVAELDDVLGRNSVDSVVFDPPYSEDAAERLYDGYDVEDEKEAIETFHHVLRPGGVVVMLGYSTTCMPAELGYRRQAVSVFNTLGRANDWLGVADRRDQLELDEDAASVAGGYFG